MPYVIFRIKLRDNIRCRFSKNFTNNTRQHDLAFPWYYRIYVSLQGRFLRPTSEDNPPTCSFLSIARLQSYTSGSKKRNFGVLEFSPHMIIDTDHPCTEKTILVTRCSQIYLYPVFNLLTMTQYDILAPERSSNGLKVRITADRKGRYTLLLGFLFLHQFEAENGCIHGWIILLRECSQSVCSNNFRIWVKSTNHCRQKGSVYIAACIPVFHQFEAQTSCFMERLFRFAIIIIRFAQNADSDNI